MAQLYFHKTRMYTDLQEQFYIDEQESTSEPPCIKLQPIMSGEYFKRLVKYEVIVECWDRVKGSVSCKRRYCAEFTAEERKTIARYHGKFYTWHLRTGTPQRVIIQLDTLALLQRAVSFFAAL